MHTYPTFFHGINMDRLNEQFQLLLDDDIPATFVSTEPDSDETYYHVDQVWGFLKNIQKPGSITREYDLLYKVAEVVLTIPHSNAGEERIY